MDLRSPVASDVASLRAFLASNGWAHRLGDDAWLAKLIASSRALAAFDEQELVGFARAVTDGLSNGYLSMVAVHPEFRHRGIGSRLVREIIGASPGVTWVLRASRPGARAFFEQLGFRASSDAMELHRESRQDVQHGASSVHLLTPLEAPGGTMTVQRMDNVGIVVEDLDAAIAFFIELGLALEGRAPIDGEWAGRVTGLPGMRVEIAMMRTPDGHSRLELSRFFAPAVAADHRNAPVNALGYLRVMFAVADIDDTLARLASHGARLVGEVVQYRDVYRLCYVRGPEGILIGLAEELRPSSPAKVHR